jgi:Na+/proline symporter
MCSLSSGLTATTSVVTVDLIDRFRRVAESEQTHVRRAKLISLAIGVVVVFLSLGIGLVSGNLLAVTNKVTNLLVAPLFLLFFMAMFVPFATTWGTLAGVASGIAVAVAIAFFEVFGLSFIWIMPGSLAVGIAVAVVFSLLLPGVAAPMPARDDDAAA